MEQLKKDLEAAAKTVGKALVDAAGDCLPPPPYLPNQPREQTEAVNKLYQDSRAALTKLQALFNTLITAIQQVP